MGIIGNRPFIGFIVSRLNGSYTRGLWPEILRSGKTAGVNGMVFADFARRRVHDLAKNMDALIIAAGDLSIFSQDAELDEFYRSLDPIPRVYLSAPRSDGPCFLIDNRTGVGIAMNHIAFTHGTRDIAFLSGPLGHKEADERFAAYRDALAGLGQPYREELYVQGDFRAESGERALRILFDERGLSPRAIFCANDVMAQGVVEAALARGIAVPQKLIVVGFDDAIRARACRVPLTTVRQPFASLASEAVKAAVALARGTGPVESRFFPTRLIVRRSCGCGSEGLRGISLYAQGGASDPEAAKAWPQEAFERALTVMTDTALHPTALVRAVAAIVDAYAEENLREEAFLGALEEALAKETQAGGRPSAWHAVLNVLHNRPPPVDGAAAFARSALLQKARILVEEAAARERFSPDAMQDIGLLGTEDILSRLLMDLSFEGLGRLLAAELPKAGIPSAIVSVFEPGAEGGGQGALRPLCAYCREGQLPELHEPYPADQLFPPGFPMPTEPADFVALSLRHGDEDYGFAILEMVDPSSGLGYEAIARQIGSVLKGILIQDERRAALEALNEANRRLYGLARRDELTGLLNRRGFMEEAARAIDSAKRLGEPCALFFMDMDDLKKINDSHGHDAGDEALRALASVLVESFRSTDAVGRVGGDEFVALSVSGPEAADAIRERIASNLAVFNASAGRSFSLAVSIGMALSYPEGGIGLEEMMRQADAEAYREKMRRKGDREGGAGAGA
jgi:diguanylate cyclase (GGDEF)-like protein